MVILNKHSFKLPRIEKEKFIRLIRLGLEYNRDQGYYCISSYNNIGKLVDTISSILNAEKIMFLQSCIICSKDFPCSNCRYSDLCTTKDLPFECVCPQCLNEGRVHPDILKTKGGLSDYFLARNHALKEQRCPIQVWKKFQITQKTRLMSTLNFVS